MEVKKRNHIVVCDLKKEKKGHETHQTKKKYPMNAVETFLKDPWWR